MNKIFFALLISAFLIRLLSLNQSLWLDEATTARVVQEYNFLEIITKFSPSDFHPPLYYLFMKLWTDVFGNSEIALRMPSIIFSLLTGYIVYLIGNQMDSGRASLTRMTKNRTGFWAAVFFLFNPLIIYYSQEARMYMLTTFLLIAALYFFLQLDSEEFRGDRQKSAHIRNQIKSDKSDKNLIFFNLFVILSLCSFYGSIFFVAAFLLYFLYKKQYINLFICLLAVFVYFLAISPLLYQQFVNAKQQLDLVADWSQVLGKANLKNLALIPLKFSIGRISFYPKLLYWGISGVWTMFLWFYVLKGGLKLKFLLFLVIGSLGFGVLFSYFTPLLQYFRFLYLIPLMSILIAYGSSNLHLKGVNWVVAIGFIIWSLVYLLNPNYHREDWKSLSRNLIKDEAIYMIYSSSDPILYYRQNIKVIDLKSVRNKKMIDPTVNIVPYTSDIHGLDYQKIFKEKGYKKIRTYIYRGVTLENWGK